MNLTNLDTTTRAHMRSEVEADISASSLYLSPRLSTVGIQDYPDLLLDAVTNGTPATLAAALRANGRLNVMEIAVRNGKSYSKRVPVTAADTLAEGEFNRFYIRGLCVRAISGGTAGVVVYRAKDVVHPRPESTARISQIIDPSVLLADLRLHHNVDTALGVPAGPNSGLSVHLPSTP
jgi:hypothetical protein